jgi:hypothetical protein
LRQLYTASSYSDKNLTIRLPKCGPCWAGVLAALPKEIKELANLLRTDRAVAGA